MMIVRPDPDPKAEPETEREASTGTEATATEATEATEDVVVAEGATTVGAGGTWVMAGAEGEELPVTDVALEMYELRLAADVPGRQFLIPGLQVRLQVVGEGDARIVTGVELIVPEEQL